MHSIAKLTEAVSRRFRNTGDQTDTTTATETTLPDESQPSLFYCSDCETVYIATDKNTCSTCDTTVEQVPSALAETV